MRNPRPGEWQVKLNNGQAPQVLSKIDTPIHLHIKALPRYYLNESGALWAWLWDDRQQAVQPAEYQLQAHLVSGADSERQTYLPLARDPASGQYFLEMPQALRQVLGELKAPTTVALEVKATDPADPLFLRQTTTQVSLVEPLIEWGPAAPWSERLPFTAANLHFGSTLNFQHPEYAAFDVPPTLNLIVERLDQDTGQFVPYATDELTARPSGNGLAYDVSKAFGDYQTYRYRYELIGKTPQGERLVRSPWQGLQIRFPWTLAGIATLLLLTLVHVLGRLTAKLRGQIEADCHGQFDLIQVSPRREFHSRHTPELAACELQFRIQARRTLWFRKRLQLELTTGNGRLDGQAIEEGKIRLLRPGRHTLTANRAEYTLSLYII